jgi:ABC-type sugar transport system ATPase subunit
MNLLRGTASGGRVVAGDLSLPMAGVPDGDVVLGLRPEHLRPDADGLPQMEFRVDVVEPLGDGVIVHGTVSGQVAGSATGGDDELLPPLPGERAAVTAKLDPAVRPSAGDAMRLGVLVERAHVFDARTGAALDRDSR